MSVDVITGETVAERVLIAAEQSPHEARIGAVADFGLSEHRVFRGERDMRVERKPGAGAHGPAVDRADDRFAELPHAPKITRIDTPRIDHFGSGLIVHDAVGPMNIAASAGAIALIHAGGEGAARAREHDSTNFFVLLDFV